MLLWLLVASFWGFTRAIPFTQWRPWKFWVVTRIFLLQLLQRFSFIFSRSSSCYFVMHRHVSTVMTLLCRSWIVSHLRSTKFLYCRRKKRLTLWVYWSLWSQPLVFTSRTIQIWLQSKLILLRRFPCYYIRSFLLLVQFLYCLCIQCPCLAFNCGGGFKRSQKGPRLLLSGVLILKSRLRLQLKIFYLADGFHDWHVNYFFPFCFCWEWLCFCEVVKFKNYGQFEVQGDLKMLGEAFLCGNR